MSTGMQIKNLAKAIKSVQKLKKEISENIVGKGLDDTLNIELRRLKKDLMNILTNQKVKLKVPISETEFGEISLPKSKIEILKHLFSVDFEKAYNTREFTELGEKLTVVANKSLKKSNKDTLSGNPTSKMSSGVNLRMPTPPGASFDFQHAMALDHFNKTAFIIDVNGRPRIFINPGIDLSKYVKIVCSNENGDTERSRQVFDRHKDGTRPGNRFASKRAQGYADWSLSREGLDIVREKFIDVTDLVTNLEYGQIEEATEAISKKNLKNQSTAQLLEKVANYKEGRNLLSSTDSYKKVVQGIKNLKILKTSKKDRTYYSLLTSINEESSNMSNVEESIQRQLALWKIDVTEKSIAELVRKQTKTIKKLLG